MRDIEQGDQSSKGIQIPIDWRTPENFPSSYASNVFVQAGEYEIILSFFQTKLPLLIGTPEENKTKLEQLGAIPAECVGRIIINPDLVPKIIQALQTTWDAYTTAKKLSEGE